MVSPVNTLAIFLGAAGETDHAVTLVNNQRLVEHDPEAMTPEQRLELVGVLPLPLPLALR